MNAYISLTALTGGGANSLDGIAVTSLLDGSPAIVMLPPPDNRVYFHVWDEDSVLAESSPDVIKADDNGVAAGRWILKKVYVTSPYGTVPIANGGTDSTTAATAIAALGGVAHSLAVAVNDFIVASGAGVFIKKTLAEVKTILGLGTAAYVDLDTDGTLAANSDTKVATQKAVKTYADGIVVGLLDDRGSYDASVNTWPAAGGSGTAGAILKGDLWYISVQGTLGGVLAVVGSSIRALADTPGQTASNWDILNVGLGYTPENSANKVTSVSGASTDTQYPSAKLAYDQLALKAPVASPTFTDSPAAPTAADNTSTTQLATTAFAKSEDAVLHRDPDQAVNLTAAASGSSGITVADNDNIDFDTSSFFVHLKCLLPDWTSSDPQWLLTKVWSGAVGIGAFIEATTGKLVFYYNAVAATKSTAGLGFTDGTTHALKVVIVRETASVAGSVTLYADAINVGSSVISAGSPGTVSNALALYLMGNDTVRTASTVMEVIFGNHALTAAEVLDLYRNGVAESDKDGSQTAQTSGTLVVGKRYRINDWITTDDFTNVGGANVDGTEFIATGTTPTTWTNSSSLVRIGSTLRLLPEGINALNWKDASTNALNASYPTTGWSLTRPNLTGGLVPTPAATGFTLAGGTTSKTITVTADTSLDEAVAMSSKASKVSPIFSGLVKFSGISSAAFQQIASNGDQCAASTGYIDLTLAHIYDPNYFGLLLVTNKDSNDILVHTVSAYIIRLVATTVTLSTALYTANGSSGGASFTVTSPSNGVIRITNTYASLSSLTAEFIGMNIR